MVKLTHRVAGIVALLTIACFWVATVFSEVFASEASVIAVKTAIPWGFLLLIPALMAVGGSGIVLAKGRRAGRVGIKLKRMPIVAANGLLILLPAAFFLAFRAEANAFDATFYIVQVIELAAGAANLFLLGLNMWDGLSMAGRLHRRSA